MRENGLDPAQVPVVIQYNKRDLPDTKTDAEIEETRKKGKEPVVGAIAIRGVGRARDALRGAQGGLPRHRRAGQPVEEHRAVGAEFLSQVFANIDTTGTELEKAFPPNGRGELT